MQALNEGQLLRNLVPHAMPVYGSKTRSMLTHKVARVICFDHTTGCYRAESWVDLTEKHQALGIDNSKKIIYIGKKWWINWKQIDF